VQNDGVFVIGRTVSSERIRIVSLYMYSAASDVYGRPHSVSEGEKVIARGHASMTVIIEVHKVNM